MPNPTPIRVGIIGASGYSGETLLSLLANHPYAEVAAVTSREQIGASLQERLPLLRQRLPRLSFIPSDPNRLAKKDDINVWFLALPHGVATDFARPLIEAGRRVIDLSADFRLGSVETYEAYYGSRHPDPDLMLKTPYVLPEIKVDTSWKSASLIASPGCYPTSIIVPMVPLLREKAIDPTNIVINSISGISGAGKKADLFYSFCERSNSCTTYGVPKHRHLSEIEEQLSHALGEPVTVQFTPHLAPIQRGILTTIVVPMKVPSIEALYEIWNKAYGKSRFVHLLSSKTFPDTAHVVGTNRLDLSAVYDHRTGKVVIHSALDNLIKGASGQSIQIMNHWFGFPEDAGLI